MASKPSDRRYYSAPSRGRVAEQVAFLQKQKQRLPRQRRKAITGGAVKLCCFGACCIAFLFFEEMQNMVGLMGPVELVEGVSASKKHAKKGARQRDEPSVKSDPALSFEQVVERASYAVALAGNSSQIARNTCGLADKSNVSFMIVGDWGHHPGYQNQLFRMQTEVMEGMKRHAEGASGVSLECIVSTGDQVKLRVICLVFSCCYTIFLTHLAT
jgi:hypothetical protein